MRTENPLPSFHVYTPAEGPKWSEQGMEGLRSRRREGDVDHQIRRNGTHVCLPNDTAMEAVEAMEVPSPGQPHSPLIKS